MLEPVHDLVIVICKAEDMLQRDGKQEISFDGRLGNDEVPASLEPDALCLGVGRGILVS